MDSLVATAGLVAVGAILPGPNNLVVMRAAARRGLHGAASAIGGIVAGGLAVLLLAFAGADALFSALPGLRSVLATIACAYLVWLGLRLVVASFRGATVASAPTEGLPAGWLGLFVFQLLQPGPWVLAVAAIASLRTTSSVQSALPLLAVLFTFVPPLCLMIWSSLGALLAKPLARRALRGWLDRVLGVLLVGFAAFLLMSI